MKMKVAGRGQCAGRVESFTGMRHEGRVAQTRVGAYSGTLHRLMGEGWAQEAARAKLERSGESDVAEWKRRAEAGLHVR